MKMALKNLFENYIIDKLYGVLYLDILISHIWKAIIDLWNIGGWSALLAIIPLFILILIIVVIPFVPLLIIIYFLIKYFNSG